MGVGQRSDGGVEIFRCFKERVLSSIFFRMSLC